MRGATLVEGQQRLLARAHPGDPVAALLQVGADERADRLLVLDEQELWPRRACWVELRRVGRGHPRVARTSVAGASPSRITVATIPRRRAENEAGIPPIVIAADGATGIVTTLPSRSSSESAPSGFARITPRSTR